MEQKQKQKQEQEPTTHGSYIVMPVNSFNNNPDSKNYSNCDVAGSFYAIVDLSGNVIGNK